MYEPTGDSVPTGRPHTQMFPLDDHVDGFAPRGERADRPDGAGLP